MVSMFNSHCHNTYRDYRMYFAVRTVKRFGASIKMAFASPPELLLRSAIRYVTNVRQVSSVQKPTYKAALLTEIAKPLEITSMERPAEVPEGMVRIKIHNAAVNFSDILISQGKYQNKPKLPFCPGAELSGEITELGNGVTEFRVGDRVYGVVPLGAATGQETMSPAPFLYKIPPSMPYDIASSTLIVYGTAWTSLKKRANIQPGDTVLVTSAAGGMGLAAVDLAINLFNCKVIGACGSDEKCDLVKSKGAIGVINYSRESVHQRVKELTNGRGADIIVDQVGGAMFKECLKSVAFEGRILVIGFASGEIPKIPANILLVKSCSAIGIFWGNYAVRKPEVFKESIEAVTDAYIDGKISPYISKHFPLDQINEAYQYVSDRSSTGKVVIDCQNVS